MSKKFLVPIDLSLNELRNAIIQLLASDPTSVEGRIYYNSADHTVRFYNGTSWIHLGTLDQISAPLADVTLNNHKLTNLADPVASQDAVNLRTVQNMLSGLSIRTGVYYATAAPLPSNSYSNGSSGVGATLTATANGALSVDGVAVQVGQRILVKDEATAANNGIYVVTAKGDASNPWILTRATDSDQAGELGPGLLVPVEAPTGLTAGAANNQKVFISLAPSPFTVGTSGITFASVGTTYTAGTGLTLSGNQFSLSVPVTVANGGTGATSPSSARGNLGATGKYAADIGDGSSTTITINHGLGTQDVHVAVYDKGTLAAVETDVTIVDANNVSLGFSAAPSSNSYRAVVIG
jgi:hypothetical protein